MNTARKVLIVAIVVLVLLIVMKKTQLLGLSEGQRQLLQNMAIAIQDWEDGVRDYRLTPGHVSARNNNPGNLRWFGPVGTIPWKGATGLDAQNHVIFDTEENGMNALLDQLMLYFTGRSVSIPDAPEGDFYYLFNKYAEESGDNYARFVAARLNLDPSSLLGSVWAAAA